MVEPDKITHQVKTLFTDEQRIQLMRNWESAELDHQPVVRLTMTTETNGPMSWLVYVLDPEYPELATCLCDYGQQQVVRELVNLRHLMELSKQATIPLSKDVHFDARYSISVYERAGEMQQGMSIDPIHLAQAHAAMKKERANTGYKSC